MSNSTYRWVIVVAGGLLGCVAMGALFSLAPPLIEAVESIKRRIRKRRA